MRDADHLKVRTPTKGYNLNQIALTPEQMRYLDIKEQHVHKQKKDAGPGKENMVGKYILNQRTIERQRAVEEGQRKKIYIGAG